MKSSKYWQRLEDAFHFARKLDQKALDAYLLDVKGEDKKLHSELSGMLIQFSNSQPKLSNAIHQVCKEIASENDHVIGSQFGAFLVTKKIADGGMSRVYKATRTIGDFKQFAAIKILYAANFSASMLESFHFERKTLASFDNAHIAKVLDGGTTVQGLPFLTMEYIEGEPIDLYCEKNNLDVKQILQLFLQLCDAVDYAHRRLIVHRDIKPSNILVTPSGEIKLLDFGISKSIENIDNNSSLTTIGHRPMTPAYASPEQITGNVITVATDVYSLGILLYKLLTLNMPYATNNSLEIIESICKEEPTTPSEKIANELKNKSQTTNNDERLDRKLRRAKKAVKGDLDNIILMALNKQPDKRYASANNFSTDIRRFLNDEAVMARGSSTLYKVKKLVLRNKIISLLLLTFILSMGGFTSYTVYQSKLLAIESKTAEAVTEYLVNLFLVVNISQPQTEIKADRTMTVLELLDIGKNKILDDLAEQPEVKVRLLNSMADAYQGMGDYASAEELIDYTIELQGQLNLTEQQLADSMNISGWNKYVKGNYRQALLIFEKGLMLKTDKPTHFQTLGNIATTQRALALFEEAKVSYQEVLEYDASHPEKGIVKNSSNLHNYAILLWELGEYEEAKTIEKRVLAAFLEGYGEYSSHSADAYNFMGTLESLTDGDVHKVREYYENSLRINKRVYGEYHINIGYDLLDIGGIQLETGQYSLALANFEKAKTIFIKLFGAEYLEVANTLNSIADIYYIQGQLNKALETYKKSQAIYEKHYPEAHPSKSIVITNIGKTLTILKRYKEAEDTLKKNQADLKNILPSKHSQIVNSKYALFRLYIATHRLNEAKQIISLNSQPASTSEILQLDENVLMIANKMNYFHAINSTNIARAFYQNYRSKAASKKTVNSHLLNTTIDHAEQLFIAGFSEESKSTLEDFFVISNQLELEVSFHSLRANQLMEKIAKQDANKELEKSSHLEVEKIAKSLGLEWFLK